MKKKFFVLTALTLLLTANVNAAENESELLVNGSFENGISGYGTAYSGRNDTVLPKIFASKKNASDGTGSLEFVAGANLAYKTSTSAVSGGFAYQGIYTNGSFDLQSGVEYIISGDAYTDCEDIKMRFIITENSKAVYVSGEMELVQGVSNSASCTWTADKDYTDAKMRVVFYSISKGDKIYIDNLSITASPLSDSMWSALSDETVKVTDEKVTFTMPSANLSETAGVSCSINKKLLSDTAYVVDGYISTDMNKAYVKISCEGISEKYYIVNKNELKHIQLVCDISKFEESMLDVKVEVFGESTQATHNADMYDFKIFDSKNIINITENDSELNVSGTLKKGNENSYVTVNMTDKGTFSTSTDENGEYLFTGEIVHGDTFQKTITVELSGINGYTDTDDKLSADYVLINTVLIDSTAAETDEASSVSAVKSLVTEDLLDALGITVQDVYRKADKDFIMNYLLDKDISDGAKLEKEILTAACISVLDANVIELSDVLDECASVIGIDTVDVYKDLYKDTMSKEKLNSNFAAQPNEIKTIDELYKSVSYALVKAQVESEATNAEGMKILVDYSDDIDLDLSEYNSISSSKKNTVLNEFVKYVKTEDDYTELSDKLSECVENAEDDDDKKSSSGGSSGGGGGGGFTSVGAVTNSNGVVNPIVTTQIGTIPSATLPTEAEKYSFIDLSDYNWAEESIYKLYEQGVISASDDKKFNPGRNITRAEFAKMIAVMFGITDYEDAEIYGDVTKDKWYYSYVMALSKAGIINGVSDDWFAAEENITRQDICVIISRLYNAQAEENSSFNDADSVSDYAKTAVGYMCENGYINGYEDNTFRPMNFATRAEVAKILGALK